MNSKWESPVKGLSSPGGLLVHLSSNKDAEILVQAVQENERLKHTVKCTVPKFRSPRIIAYVISNEVEGADVVEAAVKQSGVEVGSVKFLIRSRDLTNWVLEVTPKAFYALINLSRLVIGWTSSKLAEHSSDSVLQVRSLRSHK